MVKVDEKELASRTLADVIDKTRDFFPDGNYRPIQIQQRQVNSQFGIRTAPHQVFMNCDGIGTKPELAERLLAMTGNYKYLEGLAFDCVAMVADDSARFGYFVLGVANNLDVNSAGDGEFVAALSRGLYRAAKAGRFPILNGETAELGYRSPGYGKSHLNWNMTAMTLINDQKIIDGSKLRPGQPVVALREKSIRSNGLSKARLIMENAYLQKNKIEDKLSHISRQIWERIYDLQAGPANPPVFPTLDSVKAFMGSELGEQMMSNVHLPWHEEFQGLTEELLQPSTIYAPLIYEAQGGVDGEEEISLVACAHISGGGVPLKARRMLENKGLGLDMGTPFDDPKAVRQLIDLAYDNPDKIGQPLVNEKTACEQWNRGVGYLAVTEDDDSAKGLVDMAAKRGYEAAISGKIIDERVIKYRGESWKY
jgi:phosphoribosylformylglycinamidine cyclo-ligase